MSNTRVTTAGLKPAEGLFRETDHPSENLLGLIDRMSGETLCGVMSLADKVEAGQEMTNKEITLLHGDGLRAIVDTAVDAINMIGRRDDIIHDLKSRAAGLTPRALREKFDDAYLGVEKIIYLPLALIGSDEDGATDELKEFVEDWWPEDDDHPLFTVEALARFKARDDYPDLAEIIELITLGKLTGFLIKAERPVVTYHQYPSGWGSSYNMGTTNYIWLYGETLEEALEAALAWAAQMEAKQKAKAPKNESGWALKLG